MFGTVTLLTALGGLPNSVEPPAAAPPAAAPKRQPAPPARVRWRPVYQLTAETEVLLDGKPCVYRDVPPRGRVVELDVTEDDVIVRVRFRNPD